MTRVIFTILTIAAFVESFAIPCLAAVEVTGRINLGWARYEYVADSFSADTFATAVAKWQTKFNEQHPHDGDVTFVPGDAGHVIVRSAAFDYCEQNSLGCYRMLDPETQIPTGDIYEGAHYIGYFGADGNIGQRCGQDAYWRNDDGQLSNPCCMNMSLLGLMAHEVGHMFGASHATGYPEPGTDAPHPDTPTMYDGSETEIDPTCTAYHPLRNKNDLWPLEDIDWAWIATVYQEEVCPLVERKRPAKRTDGVACPNDAADLVGVTYVENRLHWQVGGQADVDEYRVEVLTEGRTWVLRARAKRREPGVYDVALNAPKSSVLRIREVLESGQIRHLYEASVAELTESPASRPLSLGALRAELSDLHDKWSDMSEQRAASEPPYSNLVIYTREPLRQVAESEVAHFWRTVYGMNVTVLVLDDFPYVQTEPQLRQLLRDSIMYEVNAGAEAIHLIGDAHEYDVYIGDSQGEYWTPTNDWEWLRTDRITRFTNLNGFPPDQRERNLIPTFYYVDDDAPHQYNMAYYNPYFMSDQPYGDVNGDGQLDVPIARWPVASEVELLTSAVRLQWNEVNDISTEPRVLAALNNQSGGAGRPVLSRLYYDDLVAELRGFAGPVVEEDLTSLAGTDKGMAFFSAWRFHAPELITVTAPFSSGHDLGGFCNYNEVVVRGLDELQFSVLLAGTCGGGNLGWTDQVLDVEGERQFVPPPVELLLGGTTSGAIAVIGPSLGSWSIGNDMVTRVVASRILEAPARPVAESFMLGVNDIRVSQGRGSDIERASRSFVFLGDPVSVLRRPSRPTALGSASSPDGRTLWCRPNPFNPTLEIAVRLRRPSDCTIVVYDVRGRKVATLWDSHLPAGLSSLAWDSRSSAGNAIGSGVYFVHLQAGAHTEIEKVVLVK